MYDVVPAVRSDQRVAALRIWIGTPQRPRRRRSGGGLSCRDRVTVGQGRSYTEFSGDLATRAGGPLIELSGVATVLIMDELSLWGLSEWGNFGSTVGGIATLLLAAIAVIAGRGGWGDWREKQRQEARLAEEEAEGLRLERQSRVQGWTPGMANSYAVRLVTEPAEIAQAAQALTDEGDSEFVLVRVDGGRAWQLRQLVVNQGILARAPEAGEFEAIERGMQELGIPLSPLSARRRVRR
jgi:hypothetical protein